MISSASLGTGNCRYQASQRVLSSGSQPYVAGEWYLLKLNCVQCVPIFCVSTFAIDNYYCCRLLLVLTDWSLNLVIINHSEPSSSNHLSRLIATSHHERVVNCCYHYELWATINHWLCGCCLVVFALCWPSLAVSLPRCSATQILCQPLYFTTCDQPLVVSTIVYHLSPNHSLTIISRHFTAIIISRSARMNH